MKSTSLSTTIILAVFAAALITMCNWGFPFAKKAILGTDSPTQSEMQKIDQNGNPEIPFGYREMVKMTTSSEFWTGPDGVQLRLKSIDQDSGQTRITIVYKYPWKQGKILLTPDLNATTEVGTYKVVVFQKLEADGSYEYWLQVLRAWWW